MLNAQPAREQNIDAIVGYFTDGFKQNASKIGIELEHTLVHSDGSQFVYNGKGGAKELLEAYSTNFSNKMEDAGHLIGLVKGGNSLTLEPAAQLELSAGPFSKIRDAEDYMTHFESSLEEYLRNSDIQVLTPGYHPTKRAIELELIPKTRYRMMNEYLGAISMYGVCMMRGSASTQVSIDATSVQDCLKKFRLANACVPVFSLICDNSPIFEAKPRRHKLVRTKIWQMCDPDRCGTVPGAMENTFSLEKYASYILDTPAIVSPIDGVQSPTSKTFGEIYADVAMDSHDVEHALSMLFNDVRLKKYIEIRPADAMPLNCVLAYTALIKGLFYGNGSLDAMEPLFDRVSNSDIDVAKEELMQHGYNAIIYGVPVSELADELIGIASTGLDESEVGYLEPIAALIANRTTLADIAENGQLHE